MGTELTLKGNLEEGLRTVEVLAAHGDDLPIRQLIGLQRGGGGHSQLTLKVQGHVPQLFLDVLCSPAQLAGEKRVIG